MPRVWPRPAARPPREPPQTPPEQCLQVRKSGAVRLLPLQQHTQALDAQGEWAAARAGGRETEQVKNGFPSGLSGGRTGGGSSHRPSQTDPGLTVAARGGGPVGAPSLPDTEEPTPRPTPGRRHVTPRVRGGRLS